MNIQELQASLGKTLGTAREVIAARGNSAFARQMGSGWGLAKRAGANLFSQDAAIAGRAGRQLRASMRGAWRSYAMQGALYGAGASVAMNTVNNFRHGDPLFMGTGSAAMRGAVYGTGAAVFGGAVFRMGRGGARRAFNESFVGPRSPMPWSRLR